MCGADQYHQLSQKEQDFVVKTAFQKPDEARGELFIHIHLALSSNKRDEVALLRTFEDEDKERKLECK